MERVSSWVMIGALTKLDCPNPRASPKVEYAARVRNGSQCKLAL